MARNSGATRFASVNLNQSYGKQPQTPSSAVGAAGTRSHVPGTTHGGMLFLNRPSRPQPAGLKNPKLTVPGPVNLPSLRRENAGNDPAVSLIGGSGTSGWIKQHQQQVSENLSVDSVSASHVVSVDSSVAGKGAGSLWDLSEQSKTLETELRPWPQQSADGRSGVYTPPGARVQQADVIQHSQIAAPSVVPVGKAVLLKGEDFPTLQASLAPVATSSQQDVQESQHPQRDKQRELKEQQKKLQQLTQKHQDEEANKIQQQAVPLARCVSLQPQSKHDQVKEVHEEKYSEVTGHGRKHPFTEDGARLSSAPVPLIRLDHTSNWADDEREISTGFKSNRDTNKAEQAAFLDWTNRESEPKRPFHREKPADFGIRDYVKQGIVHPKGLIAEDALGVEGSFSGERSFRSDSRYYRISDYAIDTGHFPRDDVNNRAGWEAPGGGRYSLNPASLTRETRGNRQMHLNKEDCPAENGPQSKGIGNHDRGIYDLVNGYTKSESIEGENYSAGIAFEGRVSRETFGGVNGQNKEPKIERRGEREGSFMRDTFNVGRSSHNLDAREGSFGVDVSFSNSIENGKVEGERYLKRFGNVKARNSFYEFGMSKERKSELMSDKHGRTANSMLHSADPYTKAVADFVRVDYRSTSGIGLEMFESKALRRKKDVKESNFRDLERESFEAELERLQKFLEDDRQRKIEEQERAIEMARKEQEERECLAMEEEARKVRLEEEAKEAAAKAEREALEVVHKAEELRRAREEEKKQIMLEEETRKENARRKLLELEERIAKREAEKKQKEEEGTSEQNKDDGYTASNSPREASFGNLENDARGRIFSTDPEDDDRAPLEPSSTESTLLKFKTLHRRCSNISSADELIQQLGLDDLTQSGDIGSVSHGIGVARASSFCKNEPAESDVDLALPLKRLPYPPPDLNSPRLALSRDCSQHVNMVDDWEQSLFGSSHGYSENFPEGEVPTEKIARKEQVEGSYNWRRGVKDGVEPQVKYGNGRLRYSDVEPAENRGTDHHRYNDKMYNHRSWEGCPSSPRSPPLYFDEADSTGGPPSGRLRLSLPKQPRVPPPLQFNKKPSSKIIGEHPAEDSNLVHHETEVYKDQEVSSKEHVDLKNTKEMDFRSFPPKLQQAKQSSSSESEWNVLPAENTQHVSALQSELSSSTVTHPGTLSLEIEPVSKSLESNSVEFKEEDSGEEKNEEMLEDIEAAGYDEEEGSYEERGGFEEEEKQEDEEQNYDDEEDEKESCDEVEGSFDGEFMGEVHCKTDEMQTGISEVTVDSFEVIKRDDDGILVLGDDEPLKSSTVTEYSQYASASDLQLDNLVEQEIPPHCTVIEVQASLESLVQPKQLELHTTSFALPIHSVGPMGSSALEISDNGVSFVQPQYLDNSPMMASATASQVTSSHMPMSVVQNHMEVPMTLQFGLLPSTSVVPATIPAIQIGSIQMPLPLHMHSHLSPQVTHLQPSHASAFQFGQLGHPIALSQLLPSFGCHNQPLGQVSMQNNNTEHQSAPISIVPSVPAFDKPIQSSYEVVADLVGSIQAAPIEMFNRVEDGQFEKEALEPVQSATNMQEQTSVVSSDKLENNFGDTDLTKNVSQYMALFDANAESTSKVHPNPKQNFEHEKNEGGFWQESHHQFCASNFALGSGLGVEGEKRHSHFSSEFSGNHDARHEGSPYRERLNWRNIPRGPEFRVKETVVVNEGLAGGPRQSTKARYLNSYRAHNSMNRVAHDRIFQKDGLKGQVTREWNYFKESEHTSEAVGIDYFVNHRGKEEKSKEESLQKNLAPRHSGDGLLGKFGSLQDAPLQSGVVHVFEQLGIEVPQDEDDFIEVRSKRQMLNDRREQREKEIKAKSKEHIVRKQKLSMKKGSQGDLEGSKHFGASVSERKNLLGAKADASGSSSLRPVHPGAPTEIVVVSTSMVTSSPLLSLPIIPSNISESVVDKKSELANTGKLISGELLPVSDGDVSSSTITDTPVQDNITTSTHAWGGNRSSQEVVSLMQIQLEEVLKPASYDLPLQPQLSLGEHGIMGVDVGNCINSLVANGRISASLTDSTVPPLNGEEIQFGAATSTYVSPISRPNTPSILGAVGSSVAFRSDAFTDSNEFRKKLKQPPRTEHDVTVFGTKVEWSREDGRRSGSTFVSEAEAEAEAAASAVAVAAISNEDPVKRLKYGSFQNNFMSGTLNAASLTHANLGSHVSSSGSDGALGASNTRPVIVSSPLHEGIKVMSLPADLSIETHSFSLGENSHSGQGSNGLLLQSLPSAFPGLDLGPMIGGHMFFGSGSDFSNGLQGTASGPVHEQGASNLGLSIAGWQQHVGSSDSFYGASHGFTGPFLSPDEAVQAPHHMIVYTNPFAPIGQFGQVGKSFMGATYIQSGKQPDWTHTPATSSCPGVGMSTGELGGGLGGVLAPQQNDSGIVSPIQRLAPGYSVVPVTHPSGLFDLSREATFQISTADVPVQPQWSAHHLQSMATTGPLVGYSMQSRHAYGPFISDGHLQHLADANMHIVPSTNIVGGCSFQSADGSVQFPDELGLGDSISATSNTVNPYVGQLLSSKGAVGSASSNVTLTACERNNMRRDSRPRMACSGALPGIGEGTIGNLAGHATSPGNAIGQPTIEGWASSDHFHLEKQISVVSPGLPIHHHGGFFDQKATSQLLRAGAIGGWSGQGSGKVVVPSRPQAIDRGISSEKSFAPATKLKQVYVVKPSAAYKRDGAE